jgi:hypothetical protein
MSRLVFEKAKPQVGRFKLPWENIDWRFEFDPMMLFYQDPEAWDKKTISKLKRMLADKRYKRLFVSRLSNTLYSYLLAVEREVEFQYRKRQSLAEAIAQDEETIFRLIREYGPDILRYPAVQDRIDEWCTEDPTKYFEKVRRALLIYKEDTLRTDNVAKAGDLKRYRVIKLSDLECNMKLVRDYPRLLSKLRQLKKEARQVGPSRAEINMFIEGWREKGKIRWPGLADAWFGRMEKLAKLSGSRDVVSYVMGYSPREIALALLADAVHLSPAGLNRIIKSKKTVRKTLYKLEAKSGPRI